MNALSRLLTRFTFLRWMALLGLMLGAASSTLAAKTYSDNGDGTVTDPTTGLQWMRCSMGQTWDGTTCAGTDFGYSWAQAVALFGTMTFAGKSDWRVPNIRELMTIVDRSVYSPAIDAVAFPNTPATYYWSSSVFAGGSDFVWSVRFVSGTAGTGGNYFPNRVRLVRAGQSFGLLDIARPSTDYVDQGNGTVRHTPTSLVWQRCAVGQTWTGSTCSGTASSFTWDAAMLLTSAVAGQPDWRLPTEEELLSLVDYSRFDPAINVIMFPDTTKYGFWSASAYAYYSGFAWFVPSYDGMADDRSKSSPGQVRLVGAGQSWLTVTHSGGGYGSTDSDPAGISCYTPVHGRQYLLPADCSESFAHGTQVTLFASPNTGSTFTGWSGACTGKGSCVVTMNSDQSVTATFKRVDLTPVLMLLLD